MECRVCSSCTLYICIQTDVNPVAKHGIGIPRVIDNQQMNLAKPCIWSFKGHAGSGASIVPTYPGQMMKVRLNNRSGC
jgi:hypothetical protein